jgi:hypothetical protein
MTESIQLGAVTLVGEHSPTAVRVTIANDFGSNAIYFTHTEWQSLIALGDLMRSIGPMRRIYEAALEYGRSEHTYDSNCSAGECDSCSARPALNSLAVAISEELTRRRIAFGSWLAEAAASSARKESTDG